MIYTLSDMLIPNRHRPGLAIRILGAVNETQLRIVREADRIFLEEIVAAGLYRKISQAFAALLPVNAVGVQGDKR